MGLLIHNFITKYAWIVPTLGFVTLVIYNHMKKDKPKIEN